MFSGAVRIALKNKQIYEKIIGLATNNEAIVVKNN